jgi:glycosyltransferase involved in cell wall biosynthesis
MKTPLLSICIATYNRADYIGQTLDSIIPQLDDDVELLVVDGASTDNTAAVVGRYADPRIRYVRLPVKGGVDRDYCKAVELAGGKFCWFFTDDDILRPGAISAVKNAISAGYGLIIVNAEVRDKMLGVILEHQRIVMRDNKIYAPNDMEHLFVDTLNYISFIGAVVIRRSIWLSREQEPYFGSEFVHIGVIFQKPLTEPVLVIAEPFIIIRYGNAQWTSRGFDIWMFKWPKLVWSFDHITQEAKMKICEREPWRNLGTLVVQRSFGAYSINSYRQFSSTVQSDSFWKFCAWLIAKLPRKIIFGLYYLYSRIRGPECRAVFDRCKRESKYRA